MAEEPVLEGTFLTHFVEELGQCVFFEHSSAAEVYGVECMIGCMLEAKISVNAAVHLACAKPFTPFSDENIDGHMIFGMTGRQCQTTIAAGKLLMKDRVLVGIDEEAENAHILEAAKKLWGDLNHREY